MDQAGEYCEILGKISSVIFQNVENGYSVVSLETQDRGETTVVGCIPFAAKGELLKAGGSWIRHPAHGTQFKAESVARSLPENMDGLHEYLSSGAIKGIGPATAALIVSEFGENSLNIIENEPEILAGIRGIGAKKAALISESFKKQAGIRRLILFLSEYRLSPRLAVRLYRSYGEEALQIVRDNPYIISAGQIGARFYEADALALSLGFEGDCPERVAAAVLFELAYNAQNGHCFIPRDKLIWATCELIGVEQDIINEGLDVLIDEGEVICDQIAGLYCCYLSDIHDAEIYIARRVVEMARSEKNSEADIGELISEFELDEGISLSQSQKRTLEAAAKKSVMVITGGPGTGKTTTVRAILALYDSFGIDVVLTAPTGRAAKRMSELSGREAQTIHRLLEACPGETPDETRFRRGENDPLKAGAVILDECSMVDIVLMKALLAAMPRECALVIVGDADQLPSVGPGNVLGDIIRSGIIETVKLSEIFRQKGESRIVHNAHMINRGGYPNLAENKGDFFFLRRAPGEESIRTISELCASRLPEKMKIPADEIQVLAPTKRGEMGTENLNKLLQQALNPKEDRKKEKIFGERIFREGDRVMQIRNNYDIIWKKSDGSAAGAGIYNGDVGRITEINEGEGLLAVDFDGRLALYGFDLISELEHAFAMTVHKAQGSEFRAVVLSACAGASALMTRRVLYTAVTRARELLIIVGSEENIKSMIDNHKRRTRYSGLGTRIREIAETGCR